MTGFRTWIACLGLASAIGACGESAPVEDGTPGASGAPQAAESSEAAPEGYAVIDVVDGGAVRGIVRFEGGIPEPRTIRVAEDSAVCGPTQVVQTVAVGVQGGLADVVVSLLDVRQGGAPVDSAPVLDQRGCRFVPRIVLAPVGSAVRVLNSDPLTHNVHTAAFENRSVNRSQPAGPDVMELSFDAAEKVRVKCDLHPWMSAWIVVTDHPYHAITDDEGRFELSNVPPGDYVLETWHETLGSSRREVTVRGDATLDLQVDLVSND